MALIKCTECGKEMSDTLKTCPHCGIEIKTKRIEKKKGKISNIDIGIIILLSLYTLCMIPSIFPLTIQTIYNITNIAILWLIFFMAKMKLPILKIVVGIVLAINMITYIFLQLGFTLKYYGILKVLMYFITNYTNYILLYLMVLRSEKNGSN